MIKVTSSDGRWFYSLVKNLGMCFSVGLIVTRNVNENSVSHKFVFVIKHPNKSNMTFRV